MSSEQATQFDKYYVQGLRGVGSLGSVYQTRDLGLDRVVALKVVHSHLAKQPNFYYQLKIMYSGLNIVLKKPMIGIETTM